MATIAAMLVAFALVGPADTPSISPSISPAPSPAPTLGPAWGAPADASRNSAWYARWVRHEADGSESEISGLRQVCACAPADAARMLASALAPTPGVSIKTDEIVACGQAATRLIATGVARDTNTARNMLVLFFRDGPTFYSLAYTFRYAVPMPDAETALAALCPTKP